MGSSATGRYASGGRPMSASPQKRTSERLPRYVRLVPRGDLSRCSNVLGKTALLDHIIGAGKQCRRHLETKLLGGVEIDEQLDLRGLLNGQISQLFALENSSSVDADPTK